MWMKNVKPPRKTEEDLGPADESVRTLNEADAARLLVLLGQPPNEYDSDDMEADFTIAVQLLMDTLPYLRVLRDLNKKQDIFQPEVEEDFADHLGAVEEFTGQW